MRRLLVWLVLAALVTTAFAQTARPNFKADSRAAVAESRSLPRSAPERQGISSAAILDFVDTADRQIDMMNSFILVRHGYVVKLLPAMKPDRLPEDAASSGDWQRNSRR